MKYNLSKISLLKVKAVEGDVGFVEDYLFDDDLWTIRYIVANVRPWIDTEEVLLTPLSIKGLDQKHKEIEFCHDKKSIENSPRISADEPVKRHQEKILLRENRASKHLIDDEGTVEEDSQRSLGVSMHPEALVTKSKKTTEKDECNSHLRSFREIRGYEVYCVDDFLGYLEDVEVDDEAWNVLCLLVKTDQGQNLKLAPGWVDCIYGSENMMKLNVPRVTVYENQDVEFSGFNIQDMKIQADQSPKE